MRIKQYFFLLITLNLKDLLISTLSTLRLPKEKIKSFDDLDQAICNIIKQGSSDQVKNLLFYMENVVKLTRIYFTGVNYGNVDIRKKVTLILDKGGPQYFFEATSFLEETKIRNRLNLSDTDYQEYLYLRAEAQERWEAIELRLKNITC